MDHSLLLAHCGLWAWFCFLFQVSSMKQWVHLLNADTHFQSLFSHWWWFVGDSISNCCAIQVSFQQIHWNNHNFFIVMMNMIWCEVTTITKKVLTFAVLPFPVIFQVALMSDVLAISNGFKSLDFLDEPFLSAWLACSHQL